MRMSVFRRPGFVHVRGGRILVVAGEHEVSTASYNRAPDAVRDRQRPRIFDGASVTARVGDLTIEIVGTGTERLLGFGYLSGPAINLCRYVDDGDRGQVSGWMTVGSGVRFSLPDPSVHPADAVEAVRRVTCGGADVAVSRCKAEGSEVQHALQKLSQIFESARSPAGMAPTADVLIRLAPSGAPRQSVCVHCQVPRRAQEEACQPFFHELLYSSPQVVEAT